MLLLGKLFDIRNSINENEEKPFLDHLDDLRFTLIKLIATLFIGIVICFSFRNNLMEIMRAPIDGVWKLQIDTSLHDLPVKIKPEAWEKATKASIDSQSLSPTQKEHFYNFITEGDEDFLFHVRSVTYWRSALAIDGYDEKVSYINGFPGIDQKMKEQLLSMAKFHKDSKGAGPNPEADFRKRTVFMQSLNPTEGFMLSFKLALYAGIALTFPLLLFFILQFIIPGLHKKEKKAVFPALAIGFGLFLTGVLFAYFMVLPRVLEFFTTYSSQMGISNDWRIGEYISFTTQFVLIFGLAFELPVVVMTLVFLGILEYKMMASSRAYALVGVFVLAAVITPTPDIMTLMLLAGPMYFLYEICITLSWFIEKKRAKEDDDDESSSWLPDYDDEDDTPKLDAPNNLVEYDDDHDEYDDDYHEIEGLDYDDYECEGHYDEEYFDSEEEKAEYERQKKLWEDEGNGCTSNLSQEELDKIEAEAIKYEEVLKKAEELEGNGEATDPSAEDREAGDPDEDED